MPDARNRNKQGVEVSLKQPEGLNTVAEPDDNNTFRSIYTYIYNLKKKKKRKYTSKRPPR